MKGKEKCRILKDIRRRIAEDNDIEFVTKECEYQGDCKGTCPKCDSELRYLEEQLERKRKLGKGIAAAALTATMLVSATACFPDQPPAGEPVSDFSEYDTEFDIPELVEEEEELVEGGVDNFDNVFDDECIVDVTSGEAPAEFDFDEYFEKNFGDTDDDDADEDDDDPDE